MVKVQRLFAKTNLKILIYRTDAQGKIIPCAIHKEGVFLKNEIVLFTDGDINIEVELSPELETVWLTQKQMGELFEVKQATLSEHINNIISSGELDETSIGFSDKSSGGRKPKIYNLDMILSVGYRVNSKRGIAFRRWANSVLKKYVIQGYAINEKRLQALEKTVDIQTKMLASTLEVEESDILKAVTSYTDALMLLDQYDHQSLKKPVGNRPIYKITYEECKKMVSHMEDSFKSDVFGVEKENGKVEGILAAVYQSVFGGDVYPSLEEKAANLLYAAMCGIPQSSVARIESCKTTPNLGTLLNIFQHLGLQLTVR